MVVVRESADSRDLLITSIQGKLDGAENMIPSLVPKTIDIRSPIYCVSRADGSIRQVDIQMWLESKTVISDISWGEKHHVPEFRTSTNQINDSLSRYLTVPAGTHWYSGTTTQDERVFGMVSACGRTRIRESSFLGGRSTILFQGPFYAELIDVKSRTRLSAFELVGAPPYSNPTGRVWTAEGGWYIVYSSPDLFWVIPNPIK